MSLGTGLNPLQSPPNLLSTGTVTPRGTETQQVCPWVPPLGATAGGAPLPGLTPPLPPLPRPHEAARLIINEDFVTDTPRPDGESSGFLLRGDVRAEGGTFCGLSTRSPSPMTLGKRASSRISFGPKGRSRVLGVSVLVPV
ncbi:hypothetical protein MDA_GLEAN10000126 [Myotis davidii]|uniref:Uncharacterized protein n=1 Tax=Myotis davidii TaxID=225400 RepID=L5LY57_MYODS|nr:hypothetical protein MDA_GLEAN10000126 [Myotis davidii]